MTKLKEINKAIQDILDTLPTHSDKIYLLEDYIPDMRDILVMFDSYTTERKLIYFDKNGAYIAGRGQGQGDKSKMYFNEFDRLSLSGEAKKFIKSKVDEINKGLDTRIPSKDIKVGMVCNEFKTNWKNIYIGKCEVSFDYSQNKYKTVKDNNTIKINVYANLYDDISLSIEKDNHGGFNFNGNFYDSKTKFRFDEILGEISKDELKKMRDMFVKDYCRYKYNVKIDIKWID